MKKNAGMDSSEKIVTWFWWFYCL